MPIPTEVEMSAQPLTIVVFGMGFGESIVVRAENDGDPRWCVVDSARRRHGGRDVNPSLDLLKQCRGRPDLVVLTHPHEDHTKGLADIVRLAKDGAVVACVEKLMEPSDHLDAVNRADDQSANCSAHSVLAHAAIRGAWQENRARAWPLLAGASEIEFGGWTVSVLNPSELAVESAATAISQSRRPDYNRVSAALMFANGEHRFVLAADVEHDVWAEIATRIPGSLLDSSPIKVPHHGSLGAIHPVLIDPAQPFLDREQIVTPFPRSGRLPKFDDAGGVKQLLESAGSLELTAMPSELLPTRQPILRSEAAAASATVDLGGDPRVRMQIQQPPPHPPFDAGERDPSECWVMLQMSSDGTVAISRGDHALSLIER